MKESMVMTLIGRDRPGLVEALSAIIEEHGGNWEESRMIQLAGEFAGLLHLEVPAERAADLERALGEIEGMAVVVRPAAAGPSRTVTTGPSPATGDTHLMKMEVVGPDHPGIVHSLAEALRARGINIEELESEVRSGAMSGEMMFQATAVLRAPRSVGLEALERELGEVGSGLMIELSLVNERGA